MEAQEIFEKLFDEKKFRLLKFFFKFPENQFYLREIAKETKLPVSTTFRLIRKFQELELIKETRLKKFKTYQLNQNKSTEILQEILSHKKSALKEFVEQVSTIEQVQQIILHGKEEKDKANVVVIGESIPVENIKRVVTEIKDNYGFSIIHLTSDKEQFIKMSEMGLFSGKRTTLYQK